MNTYEKLIYLCEERHIKPCVLAAQIGVGASVFTELKMGRTKQLSVSTLNKIAQYFEIPVAYLLEDDENEKKQKSLSKRRLLFDITSQTSDDDLDRLIKIACALAQPPV